MAVGHGHPKPLATRSASVPARHLGAGPGLVDENQSFGIKIELALEPCLARAQDIGTILLLRMAGLMGWPAPYRPFLP
jgi:hypothetical protein